MDLVLLLPNYKVSKLMDLKMTHFEIPSANTANNSLTILHYNYITLCQLGSSYICSTVNISPSGHKCSLQQTDRFPLIIQMNCGM